MFVELHVLQNFAPSCLNRDDTNTPKDCEFGGYRRARISSQCLKRAARRYFQTQGLFPSTDLATRTKRVVDAVIARLPAALRADDSRAATAVTAALATKGIKSDDETRLTQYLVFLSDQELTSLAGVVERQFEEMAAPAAKGKSKKDAKKDANPVIAKEVDTLLEKGVAYDLAMFGRMLADLPDKNRHAACQVAHALSTNAAKMETDYFTAVDDRKPEDTQGADMLGTVDFNSSCFYRYSSVSLQLLKTNLGGSSQDTKKALDGYLRAAILAIPTGRQNGSAAFNPPSAVLAVVRKHGQWSLANAFAEPVRPTQGRSIIEKSIEQMDRYWGRLSETYGSDGVHAALLNVEAGAATPALEDDKVKTVDDLINIVVAKAGELLG